MSIRNHQLSTRSAFPIVVGAGEQPRRPNGIWVGADSDVTVKFLAGEPDVVFVAVAKGTLLPISPTIVSVCNSCVGL